MYRYEINYIFFKAKLIRTEFQSGQIARILYCIDMFLIKLAILLQLLRVFVPLRRKRNAMFWACHSLIWLNFFYYTVYIFLAIFTCNPVKKGWSQRVYPPIKGSCLDLGATYIAGAVINTASDFSIVILPQTLVWRLQLSLKRKIGLCSIFLIGLLWVEDVYFTFMIIAHDSKSVAAHHLLFDCITQSN